MSVYRYVKNAFIILLFIQILPFFIEGIKNQYKKYFEQRTSVGVLTLKSGLYESDPIIKQIHSLFKNNDVKAILVNIDSPGSSAGTGESIYREIDALKKEYPKPVISLVQNVCASGAYWIACATDYIIAPGTAVIGSIGVCFPYLFQVNEILEQYKVKYTPVKAGSYKLVGDPFKEMTPSEEQLLQKVVDDSYRQFIHVVATARKLPINQASEWADGKIFTADQALKLHLIDELGSLSTAIRIIKEKTLIEGEIEWIKPPSQTSLFMQLFKGSDDTSSSVMFKCIDSICTFIRNISIIPAT